MDKILPTNPNLISNIHTHTDTHTHVNYTQCNTFIKIVIIIGSTHGQQDTCSRCHGDHRFEPQIIDLIIEESTDNEVDATIHWNEPSACCDVHYRVDVLSMSHCGDIENCCIAITNTSKANVNLHLSNEGEVFHLSNQCHIR